MDCFGYPMARRFPIDRLALHLARETGGDAVDAAVVMAIPNRNEAGEQPEFFAWRGRMRKLNNYGVRHEAARFQYHDPKCDQCQSSMQHSLTCRQCGAASPTAGRRKEKGADIKLASLALTGAWRQEYSTLIVLSQDSDFAPMIREVKEIHRAQGRRYALYSAFPTCASTGHPHRKLSGTRELPIGREVYEDLVNRPPVHLRAPAA